MGNSINNKFRGEVQSQQHRVVNNEYNDQAQVSDNTKELASVGQSGDEHGGDYGAGALNTIGDTKMSAENEDNL